MKIAIFTINILNKYDARSIYVIETLKHLTKFKDLEIVLIAPKEIPEELKNRIKHIPYAIYDKPHFRYLSAIISSIPKLLAKDYDLLHCYGHEAASIALIAQKIKRKKIPIIFEIMGLSVAESEVHARVSLKSKIFRYFMIKRENTLLKKAKGIIVLTEAMRKYIIKQYNISENRVFVAPHGIDLELFGKNYEKDLTLINRLGFESKIKKVIMYTGWISALHGVLDLVKAMEIINTKVKDVALVIVGYGPMESLIKEYVKKNQINNIIFTGKVSHKEIPKYHSIADVLVIPHVRRTDSELDFPTKLFEYLASG
ncbi:MAG: glycosyltransferase, partial [Methanosarcinales archaeon]